MQVFGSQSIKHIWKREKNVLDRTPISFCHECNNKSNFISHQTSPSFLIPRIVPQAAPVNKEYQTFLPQQQQTSKEHQKQDL